jgi:hypothetical protein
MSETPSPVKRKRFRLAYHIIPKKKLVKGVPRGYEVTSCGDLTSKRVTHIYDYQDQKVSAFDGSVCANVNLAIKLDDSPKFDTFKELDSAFVRA